MGGPLTLSLSPEYGGEGKVRRKEEVFEGDRKPSSVSQLSIGMMAIYLGS